MCFCYVDESGMDQGSDYIVTVGLMIDAATKLPKITREWEHHLGALLHSVGGGMPELKGSRLYEGLGKWRKFPGDRHEAIDELVSWMCDAGFSLRWEADGSEWSTSGLAEHIIAEASGASPSITGPTWWTEENGLRLHEFLEEHIGEPVYSRYGAERDWSDLHKLLSELPAGRWTTYKDLADAIGSSPIAVGQHIARCADCVNGYRVLASTRKVSEGFTWSDEDRDDDPRALLEQEGVRFDDAGRADPASRHRYP